MDDCLFCKIIRGELPSYKIYEDDLFFGFLDIFPRVLGHTLLIPKKHYRWVYDVPEFEQYWKTVLKVTTAIKKGLQPYFITYVTHGLEVPHAHIHILPRTEKDITFVPPQITVEKKELERIALLIQTSY